MNTRIIPRNSEHGVVSFDLIVNDQVLDPGYQLISLRITKEVNKIPTARLVLRDGDASLETFALSESEDFVPGNDIQIKVGRDRTNDLLFKGIITRHAVRLRETGATELVVECRDSAVKMTLGRHSKYHEDVTDSALIETLIGNYSGLTPDVEPTSLTHKELVQYHATDWDFMLSRADINGKLVIVDDGTISVKEPDTNGGSELTLLHGSTLIDFEAEMDARYQWKKVSARSWDYSAQDLFTAETESVNLGEFGDIDGATLADATSPTAWELAHSGHVLAEELQDWVKAGMIKSRLAKIRGRAKIQVGFPGLKPGSLVELEGVGTRFNGKAYVTAISHDVADGEWDTHIQFGLKPDWFAASEQVQDFPAAGLLPGMCGLQIGKVVQLESDPDGEDRIQVKLPVLDNQATGIWARVACLDAGQERGSFFRPEIDDEVIVGFINDDPRDAIVLGMLNSSAKPAPLQATDDNHEKGFFTRSKMRIHFHDETKTITIDTPAGNYIKLDEENTLIEIKDQNDNVITLDPNGIKLDSPKNIELVAGADITLKATANMNLEAVQINAKASAALKAEGATATLQSQGITEVKGSLVKIN